MELSTPHCTSWIDRFFAWVRRLPLPAWLFYLGLWFVLYLLITPATWIEGAEPVGFLSLIALDGATYIVYYLALMHHLDGVAGRALDDFRPLLQVDELEFKRFQYELTTLPARSTAIAGGVGIAITLASLPWMPSPDIAAEPARHFLAGVAAGLAHHLSAQVTFAIANAILAIFVYHTVRQLRLVTRLHATVPRINLYRRAPIYAFSRLTARTGIGWILAFSLGLWPRLGPTLTTNGATAIAYALVPFALLIFLLPLHSVHRLLVTEKRHLQSEVERRLETLFTRLHERIDAADTAGVEGFKMLLDSLLAERDTLSRMPTWPWRPGTVAGFLSALLIPILIGLLQQLLMDLLLK